MSLQKYRADKQGQPCSNGAVPWYSKWWGGPSLALIRNCPTPFGPRTVYIQGEADTWFSIPAVCVFRRRRINGWIGCEDGNYVFHPYRDEDSIFPYGA